MARMPYDECASIGVDKVDAREQYRFITGVRRAGTRISRRRSTVRRACSCGQRRGRSLAWPARTRSSEVLIAYNLQVLESSFSVVACDT